VGRATTANRCSANIRTEPTNSSLEALASEAAESTDSQPSAETTAASADGAGPHCTGAQQEAIGRILGLTPAGAPESVEGDPLVLIGAPRGLVSFTGCDLPYRSTGIGADQTLSVSIYFASGSHDDFERIRSAATSPKTPLSGLGDEAFTAMTLETLVIARKGANIVVVGYLVQNEENTIKVARTVLADL
jgi:hypothetical protein